MRARETHVHHLYTVPAQWLSEMISLLILQIRDRPTVHAFHHIFFNLPHVIHAPEPIQANTLTPNTRLFVRNLNTRAAMSATERRCFMCKMPMLAH